MADNDANGPGKGRSVGRILEGLAQRGAKVRSEKERRAGELPAVPGAQPVDAEPIDGERRESSGNLVDQLRRAGEQKLERKAKKVLTEAFDERRGELEELGVQTLRRAIAEESERLEQLIERSIEVKKREVRLSLLVLLTGTALYIALALIFG